MASAKWKQSSLLQRAFACSRDTVTALIKTGSMVVPQADKAGNVEPSNVYKLFAKAMRTRKQITCIYRGHDREVCPIILGHRNGEERTLTYQFGGQSSTPLPAGGDWRCLALSEVANVELRDGPWFTGSRHSQPQGCVVDVDLDVNPGSPYSPRRNLVRKAKSVSRR